MLLDVCSGGLSMSFLIPVTVTVTEFLFRYSKFEKTVHFSDIHVFVVRLRLRLRLIYYGKINRQGDAARGTHYFLSMASQLAAIKMTVFY